MDMDIGIEFEYMLATATGPDAGRLQDFGSLSFVGLQALLAAKPGQGDPELATGDLGIKSGYWYLEGDERFHADGRFRTLEVKGVEIRTPPLPGVDAAADRLLEIEAELAERLAIGNLAPAIVGFNPIRSAYDFVPPLNPWEEALRRQHRGYDGSHISTLSYGPDLNLSHPGWSEAQGLDAARKLNYYAPYILPFSFSSPFFAGAPWAGWSKRSFERVRYRPAVKYYVAPGRVAALQAETRLAQPARIGREIGRIEFKAFDAIPSQALLRACCHLLVGICLDDELPGRSEECDVSLYRRAALYGFEAEAIEGGAREVLAKAGRALADHGQPRTLAPLEELLARRRTPAHDLLGTFRMGGPLFRPGGLGAGHRPQPARRNRSRVESHAPCP